MTRDREDRITHVLGHSPRTIVEIDDGYDFEVAIIDDEWVFRFPRRPAVEEALELEIAVLPALAQALPVDVPSFEYVSRNPLFVGYRLIRGQPLVDEDAEGVRCAATLRRSGDTRGVHVVAHSRRPWPRASPRARRPSQRRDRLGRSAYRHPALDYAWLLTGPFPDWDVDPDLRRRARFYHRLTPW